MDPIVLAILNAIMVIELGRFGHFDYNRLIELGSFGHFDYNRVIELGSFGHLEYIRVMFKFFFNFQGSKIVLVHSYLRVPQAAGQVNILIFLVKIKFSPCMSINFVMQGKCLFSDISRPDFECNRVWEFWPV